MKLREMAEHRNVCSVHPMFGPSALTMVNRNILICDCGSKKAVSAAKELFADGANIVVTDIKRHDELMAYVLAFSHASNIVFFTVLKDSGISFEELNNAGSTTFNSTLRTSVPVSHENASLYHEIQRLNMNAEEMWKVYETALKEVKEASLSNDPERFAELMASGKLYLEGYHL
jgi:chorismate mutase/prephenate dehydrogenase